MCTGGKLPMTNCCVLGCRHKTHRLQYMIFSQQSSAGAETKMKCLSYHPRLPHWPNRIVLGLLLAALAACGTNAPLSLPTMITQPPRQTLPAAYTSTPPRPTTRPSFSTTPSAVPTTSPTPEPLPTATRKPDPTRMAEAHAVDASLLSGGFGWAMKGGSRLLATKDSGESWWEMMLAEIDSGTVQAAYFLDADLGWVGVGYPPEDPAVPGAQSIAVISTRDGGNLWQVKELEVESFYGNPGHIVNVWFLDSQHGWVSMDFTATMNSSYGELLRTSDGGQTWHQSQLPNAGPVYFYSPSIGWTIGSCCTGAPAQLYRTTDSGQTWQMQPIAPEPVDNGYAYNDYLLPTFHETREGILPVVLQNDSYEPTGLAFYRTVDGGGTWSLVSTLQVPLSSSMSGRESVAILDPNTWLVASMDGDLHLTEDSGVNWRTIDQVTDQPELRFWSLSFTSQMTGWALAYEHCQGAVIGCLQLYRTEDGGQHWTLLRVEE